MKLINPDVSLNTYLELVDENNGCVDIRQNSSGCIVYFRGEEK